MARKRQITLTKDQFSELMDSLRIRVSEIQRLRYQAEQKGLEGAVKIYNEDIERVSTLREDICKQYTGKSYLCATW